MRHVLISDLLFVVVMLFGVVLSLSCNSWLLMWVGMEVSLIGFVPIICGNSVFSSKGTSASESAMKYFVVQAVGSSLVLVGSLAVYSVSKTWDWGVVNEGMLYMLYLGPSFIVFGLGIKLGVFPFHFWVPSVMSGMGWFGCLVLTGLQKIVPVVFLSVIVVGWGDDLIMKIMMVMSAGSSVVGGLGGINQTEVRAVMAYSSINHMGWLLMCVCGGPMVCVVYLLFYVLMSVGFFSVLWILGCDSIVSMGGVSVGSGGFERLFVVGGILSYMGMPPFLGFGVKWFGMSHFMESVSFFDGSGYSVCSYFYFFLMFLGSLLSLCYYLVVFVTLVVSFSGAFVKGGNGVSGMSLGLVLIIVVMFVLSFLGGFSLVLGGVGAVV